MPITLNNDLLAAALLGYQEKLKQIDSHIDEIGRKLRGAPSTSPAAAPAAKKRILSPAGRAHIIAALKKRWAAVRKAREAAGTKVAPKPASRKAKPAAAPRKAARRVARKSAAKASKPAAATASQKRAAIKKAAVKRSAARKTPAAKAVEVPATGMPAADTATA